WSINPGTVYNTSAGASEDSVMLENVYLNLLALGVRDEFYAACRNIQIANGLLNRKIIVEEPGMPPDNDNPSTEAFPQGLIDNLNKLFMLRPARLAWDSGAREIFEEAKRRVREIPDGDQRKLVARDPEKLVRLSNTFASARFSTVGIQRADMELALKLVTASGVFFQKGLEDAAAKRSIDHQQLLR